MEKKGSSNINEVIRAVLNFFFFFTKRFGTHKNNKKNKKNKRHKKHKRTKRTNSTKSTKRTGSRKSTKKHQKAQKRNQAKVQNGNKQIKIKNALKKYLRGKK